MRELDTQDLNAVAGGFFGPEGNYDPYNPHIHEVPPLNLPYPGPYGQPYNPGLTPPRRPVLLG